MRLFRRPPGDLRRPRRSTRGTPLLRALAAAAVVLALGTVLGVPTGLPQGQPPSPASVSGVPDGSLVIACDIQQGGNELITLSLRSDTETPVSGSYAIDNGPSVPINTTAPADLQIVAPAGAQLSATVNSPAGEVVTTSLACASASGAAPAALNNNTLRILCYQDGPIPTFSWWVMSDLQQGFREATRSTRAVPRASSQAR